MDLGNILQVEDITICFLDMLNISVFNLFLTVGYFLYLINRIFLIRFIEIEFMNNKVYPYDYSSEF